MTVSRSTDRAKPRKRRRARETVEQRLAKSLLILKKLRDAEWMVTHDWGGERQAIRDGVDEILESEWAKAYLNKGAKK